MHVHVCLKKDTTIECIFMVGGNFDCSLIKPRSLYFVCTYMCVS